MYAVIETGGKQYSVKKDDVINVEKLEDKVGDKVVFDAIFVGEDGNVKTGKAAQSVKVTAEVLEQSKADKIIVFKYRPKKRTRKKYGHRQPYTALKILEIK